MATSVTQATSQSPLACARPIRIVTATALFDGHDAAINVMRRIMQDLGAEVIHLGHNRSVGEIVQAAIQEDANAVAVSSYQGGHMEFFRYLVDSLRAWGAGHIKVFGGGGGVIVPREIRELEAYGVEKIYSPEDGRRLGLIGMIQDLMQRAAQALYPITLERHFDLSNARDLAQCITAVEYTKLYQPERLDVFRQTLAHDGKTIPPVIGITGTGGAGKSSLVDELLHRFLYDFPDLRVAVLSIDPTRRRTGGALLGDRIRMNTAIHPNVFMRSLATRTRQGEITPALAEALMVVKAAPFDLVFVETAGIGQADAAVVSHVDLSVYVMTPEYGAASQLEKIEMLDWADLIAINKFDRPEAEDAYRDVCKQVQRIRNAFDRSPEEMPVYGTIASRFWDEGVTALYHALLDALNERKGMRLHSHVPRLRHRFSKAHGAVVPASRIRYLSEIAETLRAYRKKAQTQASVARQIWQLESAAELLPEGDARTALQTKADELRRRLSPESQQLLAEFAEFRTRYRRDELVYTVRNQEIRAPLFRESFAGTRIPRVVLPSYEDPGEQLRWMYLENVPGRFPYTAGVFPLKRTDEEPTRMFAGEGDPARTNARFKYLSRNSQAKRLSTAFDSVTLYGFDPDERPDIYGKIGTSGVSVCTLDDMKILFDGFDLAAPNTSVSMTINGPAPMILAMFFNTAIDQQVEAFERVHGRPATPEELERIAADTLRRVRGTVQADILKEDQGQNTCIFAIDFALRMQADIQEYFVKNNVRNFYSVSISGYHIAEAGANPILQLALTLANGFTFVEYFLSRGMDINDFAPNLSFFFSCGLDPEYSVLLRVARRIWAVAMRERYGANPRAQQLKAHVQTSGRSLHAQEVEFNDIRTTLEALTALFDHCNSLHTNAYDEAVTTPTEESVRRALAIQMIIQKEHGLSFNENPLQGSFIIEELTDLVEEAVLQEFERLSQRGGVLAAMERGYQRGRIQDDSLRYERLKSEGKIPIVGVNTFIDPDKDHEAVIETLELRRATEAERRGQLERLRAFHAKHAHEAPAALERLKQVCREGGNTFAELMHTVRVCSLGQITHALFEVGGRYRRNM